MYLNTVSVSGWMPRHFFCCRCRTNWSSSPHMKKSRCESVRYLSLVADIEDCFFGMCDIRFYPIIILLCEAFEFISDFSHINNKQNGNVRISGDGLSLEEKLVVFYFLVDDWGMCWNGICSTQYG